MKRITTATGAAFALSLLGTAPALARSAGRASPPVSSGSDPLSMDVAGVRLGMPLAAAQAALSATYSCDRSLREASFQQRVEREVNKRRGVAEGFPPTGGAVGQMTCTGPSGEHLRLFMAQVPTGTVVDRIDLYIRTDRVDPAALVRQVTTKYGRPSEGTAANGSWCVSRCGYDLTMEPGPRITVMSDASSFKILGSRGRSARQADDAAVNSMAARKVPAAERGAF